MDIDNYDLEDILNLFHLDYKFDKKSMKKAWKKAKKTVKKIDRKLQTWDRGTLPKWMK